MRVALLHPTYWPEVRRGSERLIHDLGTTLASQGHEVTLLTSHPGRTETGTEEGMTVIRSRRPPDLAFARKYELHLGNVPNVIRRLTAGKFDVAHAFFQADAWGALQAQRLGGPPVIFSCHGVLVREYLVERRYRVELLRKAIGGAAAVSVLSEAAATPMRNYFNADPVILPGGVRTTDFAITADRTADPVIVCAASVGAPHKRGDVLFEAFAELRSRRPTARLAVVRTPDPFMSKAVAELPDGAHWVEADQTGALAHAYASAWVSVLPSVDEAFGLVLLESLAAGTPVVAVRSGGPPDIVDSDAIGRLAAPDDPGDLARAMDEALELAAQSGTADACRARAAEYDWSVVTEHYLAVYREVTGAG